MHRRLGDHANLITGSVDSRDLADGSVRPVDLAPLPVWQGSGSLFSVFGCDQSPHFWHDFGFGYQPFGFRKDAAGVAHLRGALGCLTVVTQPQSEPIFRLKPPFCPTAKEVFPVVTGNGGGTFAMSDVEVDAVAPQDNNCEVFLDPAP